MKYVAMAALLALAGCGADTPEEANRRAMMLMIMGNGLQNVGAARANAYTPPAQTFCYRAGSTVQCSSH